MRQPDVSSQLTNQEETPRGFARLLVALKVRDFRWLWANSALTSMGMSMEMLAQGWLFLVVTDSPFWVGLAAGLRGLGQVGFSIFGGVIADRVDRRRALLLLQGLTGLVVLLIGLLVVTDRIALWAILSAVFLRGVLVGAVMPLSNALIYDTVGKHRLLNAMAARMTAFNFTRIVGSLLAGTLISTVGVGGCYLFIAAISLVAPLTLLSLKTAPHHPTSAQGPVWRNAREGINYAWRSGPLRSLLAMSLLMEMYGFSHMVMLPVIARDVLHVGASGLGFLSAASGAGALVGTLSVASLGDFRNKGALLVLTGGGAGLTLLLFALSPWFSLSLAVGAAVGATLMAYDATMATLLQIHSSDAMRGRILGLYAFTFGFTPLGGFMAGAIATILGAPFAIGMGGAIILGYSLPMLRRLGRLQETVESSPKASH